MQQLAFDLAPARRIYTVSELSALLRALIEDTFGDVWVAGEISNARRAPSGHYYFTLKDADTQLKAVCFRQNARYLKLQPQDGLAVIARGRLSVYEVRGEYQLYVEYIEPQGYGALQLAFEQLKKKLSEEGLFDPERKRPLPLLPRRIGIVTSPRGAAIADMLRILERRFEGLHVRIYPAQVQGDGAVEDVVAGLQYFGRSGWPEVVIVGRGGGSLEDLWAFNEEAVARAIAGCSAPVISAVGHQTDFTIADFVADLRAPTPSAAAELVIRAKSELLESLRNLRERLLRAVRYKLATTGLERVDSSLERGVSALRRRIGHGWQRTDELSFRLQQAQVKRLRATEVRTARLMRELASLDLRVRLTRQRSRLEQLSSRLAPEMERTLERSRTRLESLGRGLRQLSPLAVLERGYSITRRPGGAVVREAGQTREGEDLEVILHRGRLGVRVEKKT